MSANQSKIDAFLEAVQRGCDPAVAAVEHGIDAKVVLESAETVAARAACEDLLATIVVAAAGEDWKAAAWWLERVFPQRWAKPAAAERLAKDKPAAMASQPPNEDEPATAGGPLDGLRLVTGA